MCVSDEQDEVLVKNYFSNRYINGQLAMRPSPNHPNPKYWEELRTKRIDMQRDSKGRIYCGTCPNTMDVITFDLHHRHYDTFGAEDIHDVVLLCRVCHDKITDRLRAERYEGAEYEPPIAEKPIELERYRPPARTNTGVDNTSISDQMPARFIPGVHKIRV